MAKEERQSVFISYDPSDSPGHVGRLYDHLTTHLKNVDVILDLDRIHTPDKWKTEKSGSVTLVIIGPHWLTDKSNNAEALLIKEIKAKPKDSEYHIVLPVLVGKAGIPSADMVPEDIQDLFNYDIVEISDDHFIDQVEYLAAQIKRILNKEYVKFFPSIFNAISDNQPTVALGSVGKISLGKQRKLDQMSPEETSSYLYPVYTQREIAGYLADYDYDEPHILVVRNSPSLITHKNPTVFKPQTNKFSANQHMFVVKPDSEKINIEYLYLVLKLIDFSSQLIGRKYPVLNALDLIEMGIPLPQSLEEQEHIVKAYDIRKEEIEKKREELDKLEEEFKTRVSNWQL